MRKTSKIILILSMVAIPLVGRIVDDRMRDSGLKSSVSVDDAEMHRTYFTSSDSPKPLEKLARWSEEKSAGVVRKYTQPSVEPPESYIRWGEQIDEIIRSQISDTKKVEQLLVILPQVRVELRSEVVHHLSNLVGDDEYLQLGELLKDLSLGDETLEVLMNDLLDRPKSLMLPGLLEVAQIPNHPMADEAKGILSLFLDEDFEDDWVKWREKILVWLKDSPE